MHLVLHEFVFFVNQMFPNQFKWPKRDDLVQIMISFHDLCNLLIIHGTIDVTQVQIQKLRRFCVVDYYSYKSTTYNM
jgi:hypothetical protein